MSIWISQTHSEVLADEAKFRSLMLSLLSSKGKVSRALASVLKAKQDRIVEIAHGCRYRGVARGAGDESGGL